MKNNFGLRKGNVVIIRSESRPNLDGLKATYKHYNQKTDKHTVVLNESRHPFTQGDCILLAEDEIS